MSSLATPRSESSASNCCLVDEVAADLVLEVGRPVELDGALDVALVVGRGVLVDLDEDDLRVVEVVLDPLGGDERVLAAHVSTFLWRLVGLRMSGCVLVPGWVGLAWFRDQALARLPQPPCWGGQALERRYISQPRQKRKTALRRAAARAKPTATRPRRSRRRRSPAARPRRSRGRRPGRSAAAPGPRARPAAPGGAGRGCGRPRRTACAARRGPRRRANSAAWAARAARSRPGPEREQDGGEHDGGDGRRRTAGRAGRCRQWCRVRRAAAKC